jgi:glutamyl-tRNA synthetase
MHVDNNNTDDGSAVVVTFEDLVYGQVEFQSRLLDDQILLKSDGQPTYHLASVVDDHLMEITHVVRGEEWLSSTPKHLLLYRQLGWKPPQFAHLPLLVNPHDKSKLSKRQNDAHVDWYRQNGWLPEALVNYVALLGWSCGDSQIMSMQELISSFSLQNVSRNSAAVSMDRLRSFNRHYIQQLWENGDGDRNRLLAMLQTKLSGMNYSGDDDYKLRVLEIMRVFFY